MRAACGSRRLLWARGGPRNPSVRVLRQLVTPLAVVPRFAKCVAPRHAPLTPLVQLGEHVDVAFASSAAIPVGTWWPDGDCCCRACRELVAFYGDQVVGRQLARRLRRRGWAGSLAGFEYAWLRAHPPAWWAQAARTRFKAPSSALSRF